MAPKVKTGGSRSESGAPPDQFQDAETKVDAGATESQLLAAVQQLSQETCALAVWMEALLKKLAKQDYKEHFSDFNPFCKRPKNLEFGDVPVLYDMHNSRTFDHLPKKPNSFLGQEYKTLAPKLSVLFDAKEFSEQVEAQISSSTRTRPNSAGAVKMPTKGLARGGCQCALSQLGAGRQSDVSRVFPVPQPGATKRRSALGCRWPNTHHAGPRCARETLKKVRRLAGKTNFIFSFHLKDGHRMIGIHLAYQKCTQLDLRGGLDAVLGTALPVERLAQDLCEGHAGAGGVQPGTTGIAAQDGATEVVPGEQTASLAGKPARVTETLHRLGIKWNEKEEGSLGANTAGGALGLGGTARPGLVAEAQRGKPVERPRHLAQPHHRAPEHRHLPFRLWGASAVRRNRQRDFWSRDELGCHIMHLELGAITRTVQTFLQELKGRAVQLWYGNQAVVHMLVHLTSRDPALMRRMRRLWILWDSHNMEHTARCVRSEATQRADWSSEDGDVDNWRLNRRWIQWAKEQWREHMVDHFASDLSAQLPRYFSQPRDPRCEGIHSLAHCWRGENNRVNPLWGLLDQVAQKQKGGATAAVVAPHWPGQPWHRELEARASEVAFLPWRRNLFTPSRLDSSSSQQVGQLELPAGWAARAPSRLGSSSSQQVGQLELPAGWAARAPSRLDSSSSQQVGQLELPAGWAARAPSRLGSSSSQQVGQLELPAGWAARAPSRLGSSSSQQVGQLELPAGWAARAPSRLGSSSSQQVGQLELPAGWAARAPSRLDSSSSSGPRGIGGRSSRVGLGGGHNSEGTPAPRLPNHPELAITARQAVLAKSTPSNYQPEALALMHLWEGQGLSWLPAAEESLLLNTGLSAAAGQGAGREHAAAPFSDQQLPQGPRVGHAGKRPCRGESAKRGWCSGALRARTRDGLHLLRACAYTVVAFCTFGQPETGAGLQQQDVAVSPEHITSAPRKEKGGQQVRTKRGLVIPLQAVSGLP
ncbi:hypothetical protein CYMTET_36049 [Cymbomonas tetramitiformis]|uniref:Uncharacterized protein n=1 Tax=Cymbomonas tetramitiformis TaxID=36881 RepID=A0AAE0KMY8_9CHLO|nr:hypothetical protein CYMTET_36049 [Cymbomonas tetramitiformis]